MYRHSEKMDESLQVWTGMMESGCAKWGRWGVMGPSQVEKHTQSPFGPTR